MITTRPQRGNSTILALRCIAWTWGGWRSDCRVAPRASGAIHQRCSDVYRALAATVFRGSSAECGGQQTLACPMAALSRWRPAGPELVRARRAGPSRILTLGARLKPLSASSSALALPRNPPRLAVPGSQRHINYAAGRAGRAHHGAALPGLLAAEQGRRGRRAEQCADGESTSQPVISQCLFLICTATRHRDRLSRCAFGSELACVLSSCSVRRWCSSRPCRASSRARVCCPPRVTSRSGQFRG